MSKKISRRKFFNKSIGLGAGVFVFNGLKIFSKGGTTGKIPLIMTSHTNQTGQDAMKQGWEILANGFFLVV